MTHKNLHKIIFAIKQVVGKKKCVLHEPYFDKSELNLINKSINSNSVSTYGKETEIFESKIKEFTGAKYSFALINGTSALHLCLFVSGIKENTEVLIPALNYIASANATLYLGGTPHFIEVEENTLGPDVVKLEKYLKKNTIIKNNNCINKKTNKIIKALVATHIFGHPCNIQEIKKLCKRFKLVLIEDAAEGLGSYYNNKHVGTFGSLGVLSFNGNKIITTGGGGAILTNSKKLALKINHLYKISRIGEKWEYKYSGMGFNYRMPSINAQIGIAQLRKIKRFLNAKRKLFRAYSNSFKHIKDIEIVEEPKNSLSNYWLQSLKLKKSNKKFLNMILKETNKIGYGTRPVWKLLNTNIYLKKYPKMNLKIASNLENRIINLPSSPSLWLKK